ncbi:ComEC/Rec2 family competence protein [candidate division WWE3 bacterium]|uniref:ComEC/Rec2 family competence protein n=1 Tax=candidate division WWE3 bacterium TaxID=2053526 RepID=A0A955EAQ1_UNCKA|nr:ComEC/Rec2 family competence protein [candidate division WWE3 bacterium]
MDLHSCRNLLDFHINYAAIHNYLNSAYVKDFSSPYYELVMGLTFGINLLPRLHTFNDMLKLTSVVHVIVASGYNVSLISHTLKNIMHVPWKRFRILTSILGTLLFSVISGMNPPVLRAWFMYTFSEISLYFGVSIVPIRTLFMTLFVLIFLNPPSLFSMSMHLSVLATYGLLLTPQTDKFLYNDFISTVFAQIFVTPLLIFHFGYISIIGVLVNTLVLWLLPHVTVMSMVYLVLSFLKFVPLSTYIAFLISLFLEYFVVNVSYFALYRSLVVPVNLSFESLSLLYLILFSLSLIFSWKPPIYA